MTVTNQQTSICHLRKQINEWKAMKWSFIFLALLMAGLYI